MKRKKKSYTVNQHLRKKKTSSVAQLLVSNQKFTGENQRRCCSRPRHFCAGVDIPLNYYYAIIILNHKAHISRNFIPDSIFILFETFSVHFLNGPLQQIKKQFTVTLLITIAFH